MSVGGHASAQGEKADTCCATRCVLSQWGLVSTNTHLDFGERLSAARCHQGLRLDDAAYLARQLLPVTLAISRETIRRYEIGLVPEASANPIYVAALAVVYKVTVTELSPVAAADMDRLFRRVLVKLKPILGRRTRGSTLTEWLSPSYPSATPVA